MTTSFYRLGDIVIQDINDASLNNNILKEYPNTIGSEFILSRNRITLITQITLRHLQKYKHLYPEDIQNSTVIHLRLGD